MNDIQQSWGLKFESNQAAMRAAYEAQERLRAAAPNLLAALKAVVANHCANEKLFCSTCTPARALIATVEGR